MTYQALRHALITAICAAGIAIMADVRTLPAQTSPDTGAAVDDDDDDGMDYGWVGLLGLLGLLGLRRRDHDHTHEVRVDPRGTAPPRT